MRRSPSWLKRPVQIERRAIPARKTAKASQRANLGTGQPLHGVQQFEPLGPVAFEVQTALRFTGAFPAQWWRP